MSNVTKFLLLAFSLMITCLLVVYFNRVLDVGLDTSDTAVDKLNEFHKELSESEFTMYDDKEIGGSDVVNYIKKQLGSIDSTDEANIYVHVITSTSDHSYRNSTSISDIQNFTSVRYIKPTAKFRCNVIRDANDVIIGVSFQQR